MTAPMDSNFKTKCQILLRHLRLKGRLVPLPDASWLVLRHFRQVQRIPVLTVPNRHGGLKGARFATSPLDWTAAACASHVAEGGCDVPVQRKITPTFVVKPLQPN